MKVILALVLLLFTRQLLAGEVLSDLNMVIDCKDRKKVIVGNLKLNADKFGDGVFSLSDGTKLPIFGKKVTETKGARVIRYRTLHKGVDILLINLDKIPQLFIVNFELDGTTVMSDEYFCIKKVRRQETLNDIKNFPPEQYAKLIANEIAENSPQRLDRYAMLEGAIAIGKSITVRKRFLLKDPDDQKIYHKFLEDVKMSDGPRKIMKNIDVKHLCSSENTRSFFKKGGSYTYRWKTTERVNLFTYTITEDDCKELAL